MRSKQIILYTLFFVFISIFTVNISTKAMLGKDLINIIDHKMSSANKNEEISVLNDMCTNLPILDLTDAEDANIQKLSQYQNICQSYVVNQLMIFTDMPKDDNVAKVSAQNMAKKLKIFNENQVSPIVIVEPVTDWGLIDYEEYRTGFYDRWINTYFQEMINSGITDEMMGVWVPFPEANLPYWNHANAGPEDFAVIVNKYLEVMKKYFPTAKGSVLLNSATYANEDFDWKNGEYISLAPYVSGLEKSYIDSFGLQGFPWKAPADETGEVNDAAEFLNYRLAIEAADILGVKKIWLNTGTFNRRYTNDERRMVFVKASERATILESIFKEAMKIKNSGYNISINLFAENKSQTTEACDWSYLDTFNDAQDQIILKNFITKLYSSKIGFSLFDQ